MYGCVFLRLLLCNSMNNLKQDNIHYILILDSLTGCREARNQLKDCHYKVLQATTANKAKILLSEFPVDAVLLSLDLPGCDVVALIADIRRCKKREIAVVVLANNQHEKKLHNALIVGADDFIVKPLNRNILVSQITAVEQMLEMHRIYGEVLLEQKVAKKIFDSVISNRNFLLDGMNVYTRAVDIFNGDMILTGRHPDGDVYVFFADLAGHGLTAAIAVLPVSEMFFNMLEKEDSIESILKKINITLMDILPTGMFMACCILKIDIRNKILFLWNAGMPDIYILDSHVKGINRHIESSCIPLGIAALDQSNIRFEEFRVHPGHQLYMLSDGLTDIANACGDMFGQQRLEKILKDHTSEEHLFNRIISEVDNFYGQCKPRDDITLINICFDKVLKLTGNDESIADKKSVG